MAEPHATAPPLDTIIINIASGDILFLRATK